MKYYYDSPIGVLKLVKENGYLVELSFQEEKEKNDNKESFIDVIEYLDSYFNKKSLPAFPNIKFNGTIFQRTVWELLLDIPYGKSVTYGDLAKIISRMTGKQMSAQAVGQAVGSNPIGIIVPCHRVLGVMNRITGYAGGLDKKRYLLNLENINFKEN